MAAKPLKLKRERAKSIVRSGRFESIAEVLIDHDLIHLDQPFSYGVPEDLMEDVIVGSRVVVPFKNQELEGVVIAVSRNAKTPNKPILKSIATHAYSADALDLAREVSRRYATSLIRVLRYTPIRRESGLNPDIPKSSEVSSKGRRDFELLSQQTVPGIIKRVESIQGSTLVLVPTEREAERLFRIFETKFALRMVKGFGRIKPPRDFPRSSIVIGTRASIFWQIPSLQYLVIFDDSSEHYWSERNPFWNARDVALLRSKVSEVDIHLVNGFPSMESLRLIELGYLALVKGPRKPFIKRRKVRSLPDTYHQTIREGLKHGVVLVQTAHKDYSSLLLCRTCRSRPLCECGFPLKMTSRNSFLCAVCGFSSSELRCSECGGKERLLINRGAQRIEEELGKAFPLVSIFVSTGDKPLEVAPEEGIVIATPNMEPDGVEFSALVLLDGEFQLNRPTMRSEERLFAQWFNLVTRTKESAPLYISLASSHRVTQALSAEDPIRLGNALLTERKSVKLPPWFRLIRLQGSDLGSLQEKLLLEFPSIEVARMHKSTECLLRVPVEQSQEVIDAIYALMKYRIATRKDLLSVQVDPFDV